MTRFEDELSKFNKTSELSIQMAPKIFRLNVSNFQNIYNFFFFAKAFPECTSKAFSLNLNK